MQGKYHISTGQAIWMLIGLIAVNAFLLSLLMGDDEKHKEPTCALTICDNPVSEKGGYCKLHDTYEKRVRACGGKINTHNGTTASTTESSIWSDDFDDKSDSSSSSTSSYKPSSSSSKYNSSHSHNSYDDGYDDVYFDNDYDQKRYDRDDDYATGVDDAIEDDMEDGDEGDW